MLNIKILNIPKKVIGNSSKTITQYILTLYYIEIIHLMHVLNFLFGKAKAISAGGIIAILFTIHLFRIQNGSRLNIAIQLFIMDLYIPFCIAFVINALFFDFSKTQGDVILIIFRVLMCIISIYAMVALTEKKQEN